MALVGSPPYRSARSPHQDGSTAEQMHSGTPHYRLSILAVLTITHRLSSTASSGGSPANQHRLRFRIVAHSHLAPLSNTSPRDSSNNVRTLRFPSKFTKGTRNKPSPLFACATRTSRSPGTICQDLQNILDLWRVTPRFFSHSAPLSAHVFRPTILILWPTFQHWLMSTEAGRGEPRRSGAALPAPRSLLPYTVSMNVCSTR